MIVSIPAPVGQARSSGPAAPLDAHPEMPTSTLVRFVWNVTLKRRVPPLTGRQDDDRLEHVVPLTPGEHEDRARPDSRPGHQGGMRRLS